MTIAGRLGCTWRGDGTCEFLVWAPSARRVQVHLLEPRDRLVALKPGGRGYHHGSAEGVEPGALYVFRLDDRVERPDPASHSQPRGVHGPSRVADPEFPWTDAGWKGTPLEELVFYEMHVGTFTGEGTFDAAIPHLDGLRELGVTAVELMPVAQFPGERNWGYDGTHPFAVQESYGGPAGLKRLVDACHARGMCLVLDVVYNHLGPEGNYLGDFGPYFTDRYRTPWGSAVNFDGPGSDEVRAYFIENALQWVGEFHVDALRLDALHAIVDVSARTFLEELAERVHREAETLGRRVHLIAESDRNDPRIVRPPDQGGQGLDAVWNDDFHHALRVVLTGEKEGYYRDFGALEQLGRALTDGFVYAGQASEFRGRRHGAPTRGVGAERFVVFAQNHDQVGNRMLGERLSTLVPFERLKLAAGFVLLSPNLPLLFMGEEYGETAPFLYFVSHEDPGLVEAVRKGRREEFGKFHWKGEPPDPQDPGTFRRSKLDRPLAEKPRNRSLRDLYRTLLALRKGLAPLATLHRGSLSVSVYDAERTLLVHRSAGDARTLALFNFAESPSTVSLQPLGGTWRRVLDSSDATWAGPGSSAPERLDLDREASIRVTPSSFILYSYPDTGTDPRERIAAVLAVEAGGGTP